MDSRQQTLLTEPQRLRPAASWAMSRAAASHEADAAFAAGSALNGLDNLVRSAPVWSGCWRARLALCAAVSAVRLLGRNEDEAGLRDALLLCAAGDDPGPAGRIYLGYRRLCARGMRLGEKDFCELADLFGLPAGDGLSGIAERIDAARNSERAVPFVVAELVEKICLWRPGAEVLAWWLADWVLAERLGWERPVPLLMATRFGPAFRTAAGRGRVHPGDPSFGRAVCLALSQGAGEALRLGGEIERKAGRLLEVAPKIRTKGAQGVILALQNDDAVSASASGSDLSRWAGRRLFERLQGLGGVRELSGRPTFRIYGL